MAREISFALRERLGPDATVGLVALFDSTRKEWAAEVTEHAVDRSDRKLTSEISQLRVEFTQEMSQLRSEVKQEINDLRSEVKQEIYGLRSEVKQDIHDLRVELKGDIAHLDGSVKNAVLHQTRWMFGMWVGQLAATAAFMAAMFRIYSP